MRTGMFLKCLSLFSLFYQSLPSPISSFDNSHIFLYSSPSPFPLIASLNFFSPPPSILIFVPPTPCSVCSLTLYTNIHFGRLVVTTSCYFKMFCWSSVGLLLLIRIILIPNGLPSYTQKFIRFWGKKKERPTRTVLIAAKVCSNWLQEFFLFISRFANHFLDYLKNYLTKMQTAIFFYLLKIYTCCTYNH